MNSAHSWRNRRNQLNMNPIPAFGMYSISNYSTDSQAKSDLTKSFAEEMLIHNLHMIPNPLQKNLADTMPTAEPKPKPQAFTEPKMEKEQPRSEYYPSFTGIGSFFSGVLSVISGGMFQRRRPPAPQYYDSFDREPSDWQASKREDLNKSTRAEQSGADCDAMSADCKAAAAHCEEKLNRVRHILTSKPVPTTPKFRRRPRRAFIEAGSVEESFEDAFSPEDFVRLSNNDHIECFSPYTHHTEGMIEAEAAKVKTEIAPVKEAMDIVQTLPGIDVIHIEANNETVDTTITLETPVETKCNETKQDLEAVKSNTTEEPKDEKQEIIAACEDKVNKLKALLQCRKPRTSRLDPKPSTDSSAESVTDKRDNHNHKSLRIEKPQDKHYKNPNRGTDKRKKAQLMKNIQDDMCFANTMEPEEVSSPDNSPSVQPTKLCDMITLCPKVKETPSTLEPEPEPEYFDEVLGRFRSTSTTDSEDSFQIVFTDSQKASRSRKVSDCDSEDSFIVFEDSPDSCYTSHDVFGDTSEADSDSDSDISDSGCGVSCKLSHSMTRTVGDLTDDSLFDNTVRADSEDEVDSAVTVCEDIPELTEEPKNTGLLLTDAKKQLKKQQPPKKVSFSEKPPQVRVMRVWAFASRQARCGNWEQHALDRDRFKRKIADVDMAVSWVLKPQHRSRVMFQRFMPWWNAQRRLEIAEKKRKQEEERIKEEERKTEEQRLQAEEEERLKEERLKAEGKETVEANEVSDTVDALSNSDIDKRVTDTQELEGTKYVDKVDNSIVIKEEIVATGSVKETKAIDNVNVKIDSLNSVDVQALAKCDFYDKSDKSILNSGSKTNSIEVSSKVVVDT